jgi:hypothetical protein
MDGLDMIELRAVYGFKDPIVIDLETVDSDWLDAHCDVLGFARTKAEIPAGLWLARGCVVEVSETRLVARRDERAVRTFSGPIAVYFTALSAKVHRSGGSGLTPGTAHLRGWSPQSANTESWQSAT